MAVSLNSVVGFNSTLQRNWQHFLKNGNSNVVSVVKASYLTSAAIVDIGIRESLNGTKGGRLSVLVANGDGVATNISDIDLSNSEDSSKSDKPESGTTPNGRNSSLKRSRLTAREKLRAARVLSRYTETKAPSSSPKLGSKLLEALKESDKGKKRPGLPEAPTNLLDDSKRGMPKKGWTFELPGNSDVLLIIFSVVFISTVMFSTTYFVWKVGAIHFNDN